MASDEELMHHMHDEFASTWSRGDAPGAARFWTEDGVRVGAVGDVEHGRGEIAAALTRLFDGPFKGASVRFAPGSIRRLGSDLALYQGELVIEPGGDRAPLKGYVVDVMKKVDGSWLMLESHPKLYPPPFPG